MNLLILGAGGHGHVVKEVAQAINQYEKIEFLDDNSTEAIGKLEDYQKFIEEYKYAFVAMGNSNLREKWQENLKESGYKIPVLIHPQAILSSSCEIKKGTVVMAGAIVQSNVRIEVGCILSAGSIVDHDAKVERYSHINAGAIVPSMAVVPEKTKVDYGITYR